MRKDIAFGGVTRVPGGAVSGDGDLCAAVDVCNDGMGLEMLEKPEVLFSLRNEDDTEHGLHYTETLLCVHEPEGEEHKHYITQLIVEGDSGPASAGGGGDEGSELPSTVSPVTTDNVLPPDTPYVEPTTPADPGDIGNINQYSEPTPYNDVVPAVDNPTADDVVVPADYVSLSTHEKITNSSDNGGTSVTPPPGGGSVTTDSEGVYLCYWAKEANEYICKQMIDITPYGKINAIQPMGNTLICNHSGGTAEVDNVTVTYPAELRYWLWKADEGEYIGLGSKPPMVNITFGLSSTFEFYPKTKSELNTGDTPVTYKRYNGIKIDSKAYTDTIPMWWSQRKGNSWVPPYEKALSEYHHDTYNYGGEGQDTTQVVAGSTLRLTHFKGTYSIDGVVSPDGKTDVAGMKINWTTMALGAYNKFIGEQTKDNKFVFPFYVRYAYEMYDGSLIMHSNPVLLIPNSRGPIFALDGAYGLSADLDDATKDYEKVHFTFQGRVYGFSSKLMHHIAALSAEDQQRLLNWKDLIRGISIYITPPIYNYNQGGQVLGWHSMSAYDPENNYKDPWERHYTVGEVTGLATQGGTTTRKGVVPLKLGFTYLSHDYYMQNAATLPSPGYCLTIPQKDEDEVYKLHENAGQFYRLVDIEFDKLKTLTENGQSRQELVFKGKRLQTIATQDIMQDDNGSRDAISAETLYSYNRRLNMANVSRVLSSPLPVRVQWGDDLSNQTQYWQVVIYAKNGGQIAQLKVTEDNSYCVECPQYLFYPNTAAYEAVIVRGSVMYKVKMKEHKALNGAFWLSDFYNNAYDLTTNDRLTGISLTTEEYNKIVDESNKIYTTETDNPFYVPFGNINIAGGGDVRALCSATQALSQGQFGQHPMYCFTSEGVWAMSVNQTGGWGTIQPVTRDVISEGTMPLSLDSTVVFLTERGLLQLAGSQVKVLSDVLQGADPLLLSTPNFGLHRLDELCGTNGTNTSQLLGVATALANGKFPEKAWLAYDYDNARIYVTEHDGTGSWVYNIKSGLWTQASVTIDRQTPTYPELETQSGNNVIHISVDRAMLGNLCDKGLVITRPVKFADMGALKRWRELVVRGRFVPYGNAVQCALWGTRNWVDHALVASSQSNRLTRWGGSPYFGHSVGLFLTKPTGYALQVSGMDAEIEAERMNKLR